MEFVFLLTCKLFHFRHPMISQCVSDPTQPQPSLMPGVVTLWTFSHREQGNSPVFSYSSTTSVCFHLWDFRDRHLSRLRSLNESRLKGLKPRTLDLVCFNVWLTYLQYLQSALDKYICDSLYAQNVYVKTVVMVWAHESCLCPTINPLCCHLLKPLMPFLSTWSDYSHMNIDVFQRYWKSPDPESHL